MSDRTDLLQRKQMCTLLLVDNGSRCASATLGLRRVAATLSRSVGRVVHPVSLLHSADVPAEELEGTPADTLAPFLMSRARAGERRFLVLPLFFGPSRALTSFIPQTVAEVSAVHGPLDLRVAQNLCPLPQGEQRLADILHEHTRDAAAAFADAVDAVVLVDHGSPLPEVTATRRWLAAALQNRLGSAWPPVTEAVMERRAGARYDFNGELLEQVLDRLARQPSHRSGLVRVIVAMQFIAPGRHAGEDGDVQRICAASCARYPNLAISRTRLIGEHPGLIEILASRLREANGHP